MLHNKVIVGFFSKVSSPQIFGRSSLFAYQQNYFESKPISNLIRNKQVKFLEGRQAVLLQQKSEVAPLLAPYEFDYVSARRKREALEEELKQKEKRWSEEFSLTKSQLNTLKTEYQTQSLAMSLQLAVAKNQVDAVVYRSNESGAASLLQLVEPLEERTKKFLQLKYEYQLVNKRYEDMLYQNSSLDFVKQSVRELKEQEEKSLQKYRSIRKQWNEVTYQQRRIKNLLNEVQMNSIGFAGGIFDLFTWRFWKSLGETIYISQRR